LDDLGAVGIEPRQQIQHLLVQQPRS